MPECVALEFLEIGAVLGGERRAFWNFHLPVQQIHAGDAKGGSFFNDGFNGNFRRAEVPVGIGREAELNARLPL